MSGISQVDKILKEKVLDLCWEYIRDNFHKFNETNKIKISIALCTKNIPQAVEGVSTQVVVMNDIKKDDVPIRYKIGDQEKYADTSSATEYTSQITPADNGV